MNILAPHTRVFFVLASCLLWATPALAQWYGEVFIGNSFSHQTRLSISQDGFADRTIGKVDYETRPWITWSNITENYYSVRVGYLLRPDIAIESEFLHDKVYYLRGDDPKQLIQHFELSDGINFWLFSAAYRYPLLADSDFPDGRVQLLGRAGLGPVITNPASTIRGKDLGHDLQGNWSGYHFSGIGGQLGVQGKYFWLPWLASSLEYKFTYTHFSTPIADGSASGPLAKHHLLLGINFSFDATGLQENAP
jgi:hypothetical protein